MSLLSSNSSQRCLCQITKEIAAFEFQIIEPGASQLAKLESEEYRLEIYHDRQGTLSFNVPLEELAGFTSGFPARYRHAIERHGDAIEHFLGTDTDDSIYSGRPDLVIEVYHKGEADVPTAVVLGEVKYTNSRLTFSRGMRELSEYMEFAQSEGYLSDHDVPVSGILVTDGLRPKPMTRPMTSSIFQRVTYSRMSDGMSGYRTYWRGRKRTDVNGGPYTHSRRGYGLPHRVPGVMHDSVILLGK